MEAGMLGLPRARTHAASACQRRSRNHDALNMCPCICCTQSMRPVDGFDVHNIGRGVAFPLPFSPSPFVPAKATNGFRSMCTCCDYAYACTTSAHASIEHGTCCMCGIQQSKVIRIAWRCRHWSTGLLAPLSWQTCLEPRQPTRFSTWLH